MSTAPPSDAPPPMTRPRGARFVRGTRLRNHMRASLIDGGAHAAMIGIGEAYLAAFLLAAFREHAAGNAGQIAAALITTLPVFLGSLLQLISPWGIRRLGSNRVWVIRAAALQAFCFLPLALAAVIGDVPIAGVFALVTLYHAAGLATGAAWLAWISSVVPARIHPHYFGYRTRWCQAATLAGLVLGGVVLRAAELVRDQALVPSPSRAGGVIDTLASALPAAFVESGRVQDLPLYAFACLFLIAAALRGVSTLYLIRQTESLPLRTVPEPISHRSLGHFGRTSTGRLITYMCAANVAIHSANAFLHPYLLTQHALPYDRYMALIAALYVGRIALLPLLGRFAKRYGEHRLLKLAGLAIVPMPLFWMVGPWAGEAGFWVLLAAQLLAGGIMGAHELSTFLMILQSIPEKDRTNAVTTLYVGNSSSMLVGSLAATAAVPALMAGMSGVAAYWTLFAGSTLLRAATIPLLNRAAREPQPTPDAAHTGPDVTVPVPMGPGVRGRAGPG